MDVFRAGDVLLGDSFLVQPAKLLVPDHDAGFDNRRAVRGMESLVEQDPCLFEQGMELVAFGVLPDPSANFHPGSQALEVEGNIGGTACHMFLAVDIHYGYGGFGGYPRGVAKNVAVQHEVADNKDFLAINLIEELLHAAEKI